MIKQMFFIILSIALVACNGNYPDKNNEDIKLLKLAGEKAIFLIGEPVEVVDSIMLSVGFKRTKPQAYFVGYHYNEPLEDEWIEYGHLTQDNLWIFNKIISSKKMYVELHPQYHDNVCRGIDARAYFSNDIPHISSYYLALSNRIYTTFTSIDNAFRWGATVGGPTSPIDHHSVAVHYDMNTRKTYEAFVRKDHEELHMGECGVGDIVKGNGETIKITYSISGLSYLAEETAAKTRGYGMEPEIEGFFSIDVY